MAKNNLFSWKRSDSKGSVGKKHNTEVQAWIKRMHQDSDSATIDAYGDAIPGLSDIGVMQPDDQAIYEAQELLDKWMQDKHLSDLKMEVEFKDEKWATSVKPFVNGDDNDIGSEFSLSEDGHILTHKPHETQGVVLGASSDAETPVFDDFNIDYEAEANKMFQKFMNNTNVETTLMSDLGVGKVTKNFRDPRPKMEQRHQLVKERNKERKEKMKTAQREKMLKKDAELIARKKIQEEEKSRKMKKQMEEAAIQRQMALIRKEMEEEKARATEEEERKRRVAKEAGEQMKLEFRQKQIMKKEEEERRRTAEEKMRRKIMIEMEEKTMQEAARNMRLLHKCFSAWYGVVVDYRVKVGKARAMFDWRCKLRAWNAWRAFIHHVKSCKEAEEIALAMKIKYRKERMAIDHFSLKILRKCFVNWQSWLIEQQRLKEIKREQEANALKMAAFLDAAASGRLWNITDKKESARSVHVENNRKKHVEKKEDVDDKINEIFQSEGRSVKPSPRHSKKKKQLSITLNRQELLKESATRIEKLNERTAMETMNDIFGHETERRHSECNHGQAMGARNEAKTITKTRNSQSAKSCSRIGTESQRAEVRIDAQITRLDDIDACIVDEDGASDDSSAKQSKDELVSRKPTVKSDRPVTKPVLLPMEERARQRAERKALMEEKRKRQEEQKLEQLKLEQEKLVLAEMQMKKEKMQKKKEEERLQREREIEKRRKQEEYRLQCNKADEHYQLNLIRRYGILPWKNLVEISRLNAQIAVTFHSRLLFRKVLAVWKDFAEESKSEKQHRADECYRIILLRRSLNGWKRYGKHYDLLDDMARRHFSTALVRTYFHCWQYFVTNERLAFWANEEKAEDHDEWRILKASFRRWKSFIAEIKEERIREKRKAELRKRVREWLPDFQV